jgi:pyridoxamine 5'-phosphate oxidase
VEITRKYHGIEIPRPPHWGGYRVALELIEFWRGDKFRLHDRVRYTRSDDGSYRITRLCP